MRVLSIIICCAIFVTVSQVARAAKVTISEYPDRIVVECDGSMDAKEVADPATSEPPSTNRVANPLPEKPAATSGNAANEDAPPTDQPVTTPAAKTVAKPYNRGEQIKAYLAQLPDRRTAVESRLEDRQMRWSKKQAPKSQ